jgi:hypothetical protein
MAINAVKTPFTNMSFTPDVPSSALAATEYNVGYNIETDVRSVKSVAGDVDILTSIPGNVIHVTSGFRNNDVYWFIAATEQGSWYAMDQTGNIANITPTVISGIITSNNSFTNLTGNISATGEGTWTNIIPKSTSGSGNGATFNVFVSAASEPYNANGTIISTTTFGNLTGNAGNTAYGAHGPVSTLSTSGSGHSATFEVLIGANANAYSTSTTILAVNGGYGYNTGDTVTLDGAQLGGNTGVNNLTFTLGTTTGNATVIQLASGGHTYQQGDTITLSGTNLGGASPTNDLTFTIANVTANINPGNFTGYSNSTVITSTWNGSTLFVNDMINPPMYLTGQATQMGVYDFPNPGPGTGTGDTYIWNYDVGISSITGNTTPLYSSFTAGFVREYNSPTLGALLIAGNFTGVYNSNVSGVLGGTVQYLPTTVRWSQNFGLNSGPLTWAPTVTNIANETEVPVRGPLIDGFSLVGNFYVFSYWDCVVLSPIAYTSTSAPVFGIRPQSSGRGLLNENCWAVVDTVAYGVDARDIWRFDGGTFTPIGNQRVKNYFYNNLNAAYINQVFMVHNSEKYQIEIYYPDVYSTGFCNQMLAYRYDLDVWQPPRQVTQATMATEAPRFYSNSSGYFNVVNLATRGLVYSSGAGNVPLVQKDYGTSFLGNTAISSLFQRNNISFGQPYSASVLVHRVLPEVYGTGNIQVTVGGADSVASTPTFRPTVTMPIVTDNPWVQIDQNEARVTTVQVSNSSNTDQWQLSAANWQVTVVQDTR